MICTVLIMTIIFISGIENSKQKVRHLDAVWREEDIDVKTKAWLLMVESGKVDQEELRRITPKSIFIAPLLTSRTSKCQEGFRHDHLGQCVKVIKADPKVQLELLLKKLNSLYGDKEKSETDSVSVPVPVPVPVFEEEDESKGISEPSTGPLQFSIPILNEEEREPEMRPAIESPEFSKPEFPGMFNSSQFVPPKNFEFIPVPLPLLMLNRTLEFANATTANQTTDFEFSGAGPLNDTETYAASGYNYTDVSSGDYSPEEDTITPETVFLEDTD